MLGDWATWPNGWAFDPLYSNKGPERHTKKFNKVLCK